MPEQRRHRRRVLPKDGYRSSLLQAESCLTMRQVSLGLFLRFDPTFGPTSRMADPAALSAFNHRKQFIPQSIITLRASEKSVFVQALDASAAFRAGAGRTRIVFALRAGKQHQKRRKFINGQAAVLCAFRTKMQHMFLPVHQHHGMARGGVFFAVITQQAIHPLSVWPVFSVLLYHPMAKPQRCHGSLFVKKIRRFCGAIRKIIHSLLFQVARL